MDLEKGLRVSGNRPKDIRLKGISASAGIVIGKAYHVDRGEMKIIYEYLLNEEQVSRELKRFDAAVGLTEAQLRQVKKEVPDEFKDHAYILDAHLLILKDRMVHEATRRTIDQDKINVEWALKKSLETARQAFSKIRDPYIRGRIKDMEDVVGMIMRNLAGKRAEDISTIKDRVIVVAHDLSPADTSQMNLDRVMGFVTNMGSKTSHTSIVAQSLQIPAVVGLERATDRIGNNELVILDGTTGDVIVNPSEDVLQEYKRRKRRYEEYHSEIVRCAHLPAETLDGHVISIRGNIELLEEVTAVLDYGAEGVGLYRTEFLYLSHGSLPEEDELFENYREVAEILAPESVTIRTLDIGGDKFASQLELSEEMNPALGLRAIRFCLKMRHVFEAQLRAICRASHYGHVKILFPLISGVSEIVEAKKILREVQEKLSREGVPFDKNMEVGIMVEVPSAVTVADLLAREVDFFSIGTNDLIQYSLAVDRTNEYVAHLYMPYHPALLRMIRHVVLCAKREGIRVAMCGEMAGDPLCVPLLLAMGLNELSMNPHSIPIIKRIIRLATLEECREYLAQVMDLPTGEEVKSYLTQVLSRRFPEEFALNLPEFREVENIH